MTPLISSPHTKATPVAKKTTTAIANAVFPVNAFAKVQRAFPWQALGMSHASVKTNAEQKDRFKQRSFLSLQDVDDHYELHMQ